METFFNRFRSALVLAAVLLAQVIGLASQMRRARYASREDGHHLRLARAWSAYTNTPFEIALKRAGGSLRGAWHGYIDLRHVRQHDRDLQYQIDQLRLREAWLTEDARQGQRLQKLLAFKEQYVGHTVAAEVVGTGGGDQTRILTIDKGSDDGLRPDMAVITPDGIVGKVRDVFADSAQVLLLNDPSSGAGVVLTSTRSRGIVRGSAGGQLQIGNLMPDERIKPGEAVVTSGGDRVFPRGLPVGSVKSIRPDPEHQPYAAITIQPSANLDRLEEVLVVTDVAEQMAKSAAAAGDDSDETGKKAADIVADRLPGLHEKAAIQDGTTDKPPGVNASQQPGVALPKPPPPLHTDRYSPGAIPPANSLAPGGAHGDLATPAPKSPRKAEEAQP
ncbi:MAG: rod shape-determining protein MreC [Janthinobacterium lividum]